VPTRLAVEKESQTLRTVGGVSDVLRRSRRERVQGFQSCLGRRLGGEGSSDADFFTMYTVVDENAQAYDDARITWNKAKQEVMYPDVVTFPEQATHVAVIVQCAAALDYYICARNGKHSYESDTCTYGIVVDLDRFNTFELIDRERGHAHFGAGQHLGHVALVLSEHDLVMPMGSCPSVGLTGLTLVGGHGMLSRHYGLTADFLSAIEMVDHKGQIIYANATQNSDLFWMARGGGSGVFHFPGIIYGLEFRNLPTVDDTEEVYTALTFRYPATVGNAAKLLRAWQDFYLDEQVQADPVARRLMLEPWVRLDRSGEKGLRYTKVLELAVYFYGDAGVHRVFMEKYLPRIKTFIPELPGKMTPVKRHDLLSFARMLSATKSNEELGDGKHGWDLEERGNYRMNRWKGLSAVANSNVSFAAFKVIAETIYESQPLSRRYVEFKALGGAMGEVDLDETAFWHRGGLWWCLTNHFFLSTDTPGKVKGLYRNSKERNLAFVEAMGSAFGGHYAGYIDRSGSVETDLINYYGKHDRRIAEIKKNRDPENLFRVYKPDSLESIFQTNTVGTPGGV
jgi:FAD/FMN-containing dehydrogenase